MAATIRQELEEEFLSTIRKGQGTALEAAKPLAEAVHYVIPTMPAVRVPLAGLLPRARGRGGRGARVGGGGGSGLRRPLVADRGPARPPPAPGPPAFRGSR